MSTNTFAPIEQAINTGLYNSESNHHGPGELSSRDIDRINAAVDFALKHPADTFPNVDKINDLLGHGPQNTKGQIQPPDMAALGRIRRRFNSRIQQVGYADSNAKNSGHSAIQHLESYIRSQLSDQETGETGSQAIKYGIGQNLTQHEIQEINALVGSIIDENNDLASQSDATLSIVNKLSELIHERQIGSSSGNFDVAREAISESDINALKSLRSGLIRWYLVPRYPPLFQTLSDALGMRRVDGEIDAADVDSLIGDFVSLNYHNGKENGEPASHTYQSRDALLRGMGSGHERIHGLKPLSAYEVKILKPVRAYIARDFIDRMSPPGAHENEIAHEGLVHYHIGLLQADATAG